jgi:hypothetical protein
VDLDRFWELVEAAAVAGDVDCQAQAERLTAMLEQLAPEEIVSFERHFSQRLAEAYRWDLCGGWPTSSTAAAPTTALCTSAAGCWRRAGPAGRRRSAIRTR